MLKQRLSHTGAATRVMRKRNFPPRLSQSAPAHPRTGEPELRSRLREKMDWADPLDEEGRRALEAAWGFVE